MFGKIYESLYTGSMVGKGALAFAVMGYVIANQKPDKEVGSQVELNPVLLAAVLGEEVEDVEGAIEFLCSPDARSRSKAEGGRRLIKLGEYDYRVVNGTKYRWMAGQEERRMANREAKRRQRLGGGGKRVNGGRTAAERLREKAMGEGDYRTVGALDRMAGEENAGAKVVEGAVGGVENVPVGELGSEGASAGAGPAEGVAEGVAEGIGGELEGIEDIGEEEGPELPGEG